MTSPTHPSPEEYRISTRLTAILQILMTIALVWFAIRGNWQNVFLTGLVMLLTLMPWFLRHRWKVDLPPEFQMIAVGFVFLSLFLGSAVDLYYRFWWRDMVLHTGSGFLLGIAGFLAALLLNQTDHIPAGMKPAFLCFFAVTFAVFLGVIWEIFEFTVDIIWPGINMQSNETGVVDTMQDLIVDLLGALVVAAMGWASLRSGRHSFLATGVQGFIDRNPDLFDQQKDPTAEDPTAEDLRTTRRSDARPGPG